MSKRADWSFRLNQESKKASTAFFVTLTYGSYYLPIEVVPYFGILKTYPFEHSLVKQDYQSFMKRLREVIRKKYGKRVKLRFYAVGEYGETFERPHYHILLFNLPHEFVPKLEKIWALGFVNIGDVSPASIHYVTKYVMKPKRSYGGREPPFSLMSRRPGIGSSYLTTHKKWHRAGKKTYTQVNGFKARLPRYYRDKIFTAVERQLMQYDQLREQDLAYWKAVDALSKFHTSPTSYYEERILTEYERLLKLEKA